MCICQIPKVLKVKVLKAHFRQHESLLFSWLLVQQKVLCTGVDILAMPDLFYVAYRFCKIYLLPLARGNELFKNKLKIIPSLNC